MAPFRFTCASGEAMDRLKKIVRMMERTALVRETPDYLHVEFRTIMGFVDDVEFAIDEQQHLIHMRSASRLGYWDLGANRRRLEAIRVELGRLGSNEAQADRSGS